MGNGSTDEVVSQVVSGTGENASSMKTRVRLLIAMPGIIVLILAVYGAAVYWLMDSYLSSIDSAKFQQFSRDWLTLLGLFLFGGAILGYAMAYSLTLPIAKIIKLSERIAAGDLSSKVELQRFDELGQLGTSFNSMVESLNSFFEMRNRFIMESFSGGLLTIDLNGTITAINMEAERILGLNPNYSHIGKPANEILKQQGLEQLNELSSAALWREETVNEREIEVRVPSDAQGRYQTKRLTVSITPMRDTEGRIFGILINLRNIQDLQIFYEKLKNTDRLATMGTFATGLAHEIRNPLGAIKGTVQLLGEDLKDQPQSQVFINVVLKEVNRLDRLVGEVQSFSQSESEKKRLNLTELLNSTINLAVQKPKESGAETVPVIKEFEILPIIIGSYERLTQAFLNILLNAIQAAADNTSVVVRAWVWDEGEFPIQIDFINSGAAIPSEIIEKIFEPFFTTKATGTGLGLSIAYQVIKDHGGKIFVKNDNGKVVVTVRLPISSL